MRISLPDARRTRMLRSINTYFAEYGDEALSDFRTERLLDFFVIFP